MEGQFKVSVFLLLSALLHVADMKTSPISTSKALTITVEPRRIALHGEATFKCFGDIGVGQTITWYRMFDTPDIIGFNNLILNGEYVDRFKAGPSYENGFSIILTEAQAIDNGIFGCGFMGESIDLIREATLDIYDPIIFTITPSVIFETHNAVFTCGGGESQNGSVLWYHMKDNGTSDVIGSNNIITNPDYIDKFKPGNATEGNYTIILEGASISDEGFYACGDNINENNTVKSYLKVIEFTYLEMSLEPSTIFQEQTAIFSCGLGITRNTTVLWYFMRNLSWYQIGVNSSISSPWHGDRLQGGEVTQVNGTLYYTAVLSNSKEEDVSFYSCRAEGADDAQVRLTLTPDIRCRSCSYYKTGEMYQGDEDCRGDHVSSVDLPSSKYVTCRGYCYVHIVRDGYAGLAEREAWVRGCAHHGVSCVNATIGSSSALCCESDDCNARNNFPDRLECYSCSYTKIGQAVTGNVTCTDDHFSSAGMDTISCDGECYIKGMQIGSNEAWSRGCYAKDTGPGTCLDTSDHICCTHNLCNSRPIDLS